jgi:hypothetical protein
VTDLDQRLDRIGDALEVAVARRARRGDRRRRRLVRAAGAVVAALGVTGGAAVGTGLTGPGVHAPRVAVQGTVTLDDTNAPVPTRCAQEPAPRPHLVCRLGERLVVTRGLAPAEVAGALSAAGTRAATLSWSWTCTAHRCTDAPPRRPLVADRRLVAGTRARATWTAGPVPAFSRLSRRAPRRFAIVWRDAAGTVRTRACAPGRAPACPSFAGAVAAARRWGAVAVVLRWTARDRGAAIAYEELTLVRRGRDPR